ncbi:MAG: sodium:calcium antiporter, partial [Planctomycetota bacterium]
LFASLLIYIGWIIRQSRRESIYIQQEYADSVAPTKQGSGRTVLYSLVTLLSFVPLALGSRWLVSGSVTLAKLMSMSELVIGLTVVAVGTSSPEVVTSLVAALRGQRDIAVGNAVGSSIFNILCVVGLSSLVAPHGIDVSPAALQFDIPVMIAVAVACLPICLTGHVIARWEGALFLFYYVAYTAYLIMDATGSDHQRTFTAIMTLFVIPLTVLTLAIGVYRHVKEKRLETVNSRGAVDQPTIE